MIQCPCLSVNAIDLQLYLFIQVVPSVYKFILCVTRVKCVFMLTCPVDGCHHVMITTIFLWIADINIPPDLCHCGLIIRILSSVLMVLPDLVMVKIFCLYVYFLSSCMSYQLLPLYIISPDWSVFVCSGCCIDLCDVSCLSVSILLRCSC